MKRKFHGPLAHLIERHLQLRASLGMSDKSTRFILHRFDTFMSEKFPTAKLLERPMVIDYLQTIKLLHPRTRCNHILCIRQLSRFLFQLNPKTFVPESRMIPSGRTTVRPYIYNDNEVRSLISLALRLSPESLRPHSYSTLLGLLWVTGIRIGEALKLQLRDIDYSDGVLTIRETKFLKSRLIPLSSSAVAALSRYIEKRKSYGYDQNSTAPLFINQRAQKFSISTVGRCFRELTRKLKMRTLQGTDPRLHDLRHAFATRWLADLYMSGKDPTAYLPILATYLGHTCIAATQIYLHPSLELLEQAGHRFEKYISK